MTTIKLEHTLYTNNDFGPPPSSMYGMEHEQFGLHFGSDSNEQNGDNDLWSYVRPRPPNRPAISPNPPFNPTFNPQTPSNNGNNNEYPGNYPNQNQNQNQWNGGSGGSQFGRPQAPVNNRPTQGKKHFL